MMRSFALLENKFSLKMSLSPFRKPLQTLECRSRKLVHFFSLSLPTPYITLLRNDIQDGFYNTEQYKNISIVICCISGF